LLSPTAPTVSAVGGTSGQSIGLLLVLTKAT